ncbi:hypothetical protein YC2023_034723 [Brassica napus]
MDVTETQQITARTIEKVVVHPLVLRNIVDDYNRLAKKSGKRVVGVLLGGSSHGIVDVINSYPDMVGWYSTGPELRDNDLDVHAQFCHYAPYPVLVVINVGLGIPTNSYYTMSSLEKIEKEVFVRASVEIAPHEVKEDSGEEHLLCEFQDTTTEIAPKRMTLGGVLESTMDELEDHWWDFKCNWSPKEMLKVIIGRAPYQSDQLGATPSSRSDLPIRATLLERQGRVARVLITRRQRIRSDLSKRHSEVAPESGE